MDLERVNRVAIAAAYKGADVLRCQLGKISHVDKKGAIDLVTEADIGSEKKILVPLSRATPIAFARPRVYGDWVQPLWICVMWHADDLTVIGNKT
jgi:hypothetical protein